MKPYDLTREAEPDTGSLLFGRKERYKNFLLAFWSDRGAVVGYIYDDVL